MADLNFQNFSTVQSNQQPAPVTVAAATTIAPVGLVTFVSGSTAVTTITPPVSGTHILLVVPTGATPPAFTTAGNILVGTTTAAQNVPLMFLYNPLHATKPYSLIRGTAS